MKVLVTFAVEQEFAPWRRLRAFRRVSRGSVPAFAAQVGTADVRVALTGIGHVTTERVLPTLFEDEPDFCISSGLAGALRPDLRSGEVLAAAAVRSQQAGRALEADARMLSLAVNLGARRIATLLTAPRVVNTAGEKRGCSSMGDAVEMESFRLLCAAAGRAIPAIAVRAVSDTADDDLPLDFNRVIDPRGRISYSRLMAEVLRRPQRLPALVRLGRSSQQAAARLTAFLDGYVAALASLAEPRADLAEAVAG
jgi:adenosylhomocysteine nucleosidase